jgi:hypothetical protein
MFTSETEMLRGSYLIDATSVHHESTVCPTPQPVVLNAYLFVAENSLWVSERTHD